MATLAEIVYSIRNQLEGQVVTDDHRLRLRFIAKQIRDIRSVLLAEELERGIGIDQGFLQCIDCLEVKCERVECNGSFLPYKVHYVDVPAVLNHTSNPVYFGLMDGSLSFERLSYSAWLGFSGGSFNFRRPAYTIIDGKALLKYIPVGTKRVKLCAALDDPMVDTCQPLAYEDTYPIPNRLVHQLELLVIKQLLSTLQIPGDTVNDSVDPQAGGITPPKRR